MGFFAVSEGKQSLGEARHRRVDSHDNGQHDAVDGLRYEHEHHQGTYKFRICPALMVKMTMNRGGILFSVSPDSVSQTSSK